MPRTRTEHQRNSNNSRASTEAEGDEPMSQAEVNAVAKVSSAPQQNGSASTGARCPAPFSTDAAALQTLAGCDYSQKITLEMAKAGNGTSRVATLYSYFIHTILVMHNAFTISLLYTLNGWT